MDDANATSASAPTAPAPAPAPAPTAPEDGMDIDIDAVEIEGTVPGPSATVLGKRSTEARPDVEVEGRSAVPKRTQLPNTSPSANLQHEFLNPDQMGDHLPKGPVRRSSRIREISEKTGPPVPSGSFTFKHKRQREAIPRRNLKRTTSLVNQPTQPPPVITRTFSVGCVPASPSAKPRRKQAKKRRPQSEKPDVTPPAPFTIDLPAVLPFPGPPKTSDVVPVAHPPPALPAGEAHPTTSANVMPGMLSMSYWNRFLGGQSATPGPPPPPPPPPPPAARFPFDIASFGLQPRRPSLPPLGPYPYRFGSLPSPPRQPNPPVQNTSTPSQSQAPQTENPPLTADPPVPQVQHESPPPSNNPERSASPRPLQVSSDHQPPPPVQNSQSLRQDQSPSPSVDLNTHETPQAPSTLSTEDPPASPMQYKAPSPTHPLPSPPAGSLSPPPPQEATHPEHTLPVQNSQSLRRTSPSSPRVQHTPQPSPSRSQASQEQSASFTQGPLASPMQYKSPPPVHPFPPPPQGSSPSPPPQEPSHPQHTLPAQNSQSLRRTLSSSPRVHHTPQTSLSRSQVRQATHTPSEDRQASPMEREPPLGFSGMLQKSWGSVRDTVRNIMLGGSLNEPAPTPAQDTAHSPVQHTTPPDVQSSSANPTSHASRRASPQAQPTPHLQPTIPADREPFNHMKFKTPLAVPSLRSPILAMPSPLSLDTLSALLPPFSFPTALNPESGVPSDSNELGLFAPVLAHIQPPAPSTTVRTLSEMPSGGEPRSPMRVDPPLLARSFSEPPPVTRQPPGLKKKKTSSATRQSLPRIVKSKVASAALSAKAKGKQRATNQPAGKGSDKGRGKGGKPNLSSVPEEDDVWESEQDEDSVYEPTDEETESERDGPSDGEESDLEELIRQRLADRHDKGSPSVSNQPPGGAHSFVTTHPDMDLDELRPLDQPENDSDLAFNPVNPPREIVHRPSYRAPSPAPLMADHYGNPDHDDHDEESDMSALVQALADSFDTFQEQMSTIVTQNRATQDFIRNTPLNPELVRAIVAEEVGRHGTRASTRGRRVTERKTKKTMPADLEDDPTLPYFREHVHTFVRVDLLKVEADEGDSEAMDTGDGLVNIRTNGIGAALLKFKPLSEEEYSNWQKRLPGAFKLSTTNFRFEFSRSMTDRFNREAVHVAVTGVLTAFNDGRYSRQLRNGQQLNGRFLEHSIATLVVERYANHLARMYKEAASTTPQDDKRVARLKKSNQTTRRWNLFQERLDTCLAFLPLRALIPLLKLIGSDGMSDDESEDEEQDGVVVSTRYFKRRPEWRGFELEHQLYTVDTFTPSRKQSTIGRRSRKPGNPRRIREESDRTYKTRIVPKGLHQNLYNATFLEGLEPWELKHLAPIPHRYPNKVPSFAEYKAGLTTATTQPQGSTSSSPRVVRDAQPVASGSNVRLNN